MNTTWKIAKLGEILTQMSRQEVIDPNKQYRVDDEGNLVEIED